MKFGSLGFGVIEIDGRTYQHDVVIDRGRVRKRDKGPSKQLRHELGHTPLSLAEDIPWKCRTLIVGTGANGALPVLDEVSDEARRREVRLVMVPTAQAVKELEATAERTNAILHLTC